MTDRNELRRMLDELADETPEVPAQEWLAGTREKVRVRRRARWASATAGAALVLAVAATVGPRVVEDTGAEPAPADPEPSDPREWQFAEDIDTERVIASRLNEPSTSEFEWTKTVRRADLGTVAALRFCHLPEGVMAHRSEIRLVSSIQGGQQSSQCRHWADYPGVDRTMVTFGYLGASGGSGLPTGETYTVSMWLERNGRRVVVPGADFGFAFFWECFPPLRADDSGTPRCDETFESDGDTLPPISSNELSPRAVGPDRSWR